MGIRTDYATDTDTMQSILKPVIGPKKEVHDLGGRVALITGGALGIGYQVARTFVLNGARVIMVNRKEDQGQDAIDKIKQEAGPTAQIEWMECDMGDFQQIKDTFTSLREREVRLDLLILSAGINVNQYGETHDKIDRHFQVNWLGQFYVCNLLYPLLRKTSKLPETPAPRIVWETSEQHRVAPSWCILGQWKRLITQKLVILSCMDGQNWQSSWGSSMGSLIGWSSQITITFMYFLCIPARSTLQCNSNGKMHTLASSESS